MKAVFTIDMSNFGNRPEYYLTQIINRELQKCKIPDAGEEIKLYDLEGWECGTFRVEN